MLPRVVILCLLSMTGSKAQPQIPASEAQGHAARWNVAPSINGDGRDTEAVLHAKKRALEPAQQADTPEITLRASSGPKGFDPKGLAYFQPAQVVNASAPRPEGFIMFEYTGDNSAHIEVRLANFPTGKGPFSYHIHEHRVPEDISDPAVQCLQANGHLDPDKRGDTIPCDTKKRNACQVGDLGGKYGKVPESITNDQEFKEVYDDPFISWVPTSTSYFGDKSIVIHLPDKTRIACANIMIL